VTGWVVALPSGRAYIIPREEEVGLVHTSLERIVDWWAPHDGVELVLVTT
jgi:hypothetical protein